MAKIKIVGDAMAIISEASLADIQTLEKYSPETLRICKTDDDGQKNEIFRVCTSDSGSVSEYGVCFNGTTQAEPKKACVTTIIPAGTTDAKAYAEEYFGTALTRLNEVEARFAAALQDVTQKRNAVLASIEVV